MAAKSSLVGTGEEGQAPLSLSHTKIKTLKLTLKAKWDVILQCPKYCLMKTQAKAQKQGQVAIASW